MPETPILKPSDRTSKKRKLIVLTAIVVMANALVLGGMPTVVNPPSDCTPEAQPLNLSVVTLPLAPEQIPVKPLPTVRPPSAPSVKTVAQHASQKIDTQNSTQTGVPKSTTPATLATKLASVAPLAILAAIAVPEAKAAPVDAAVSEPKPTPPSSKPPIADASHAQKLAYAPPVLLIYDGRGEERGLIKYAASGELLWAPDGARYNAHLEISAWGFRVRTWTSKGDLTDSGLQPLRFGDKPHGAELTTHFQREKGIISFSANNPDVPLQMGAQDKLSAILQLSAIVAGEPELYGSGATIAFQAADAHRAEVWNFKVGDVEQLDLPGGAIAALKLSKAPTVEFDQRIEVWLAPNMRYMPVRIRITEANGAFADLLWRKSQKPD